MIEQLRNASFLAVLGASGSGKSSVVRAGLLPQLKAGLLPNSQNWRYITLTPKARPLDSLAEAITKLHHDPTAVLQFSEAFGQRDDALLLIAGTLLDRDAGQRLVLIVDQAEELWTQELTEETRDKWHAQQQQPFIRSLVTAATAADTPIIVVLTMRIDFLHRAADDHLLAQTIAAHDVIVSPMNREDLRAAIVRPAEQFGGTFEAGLVDELINQVIDRLGALPLLEYMLDQLWAEADQNGMMNWATYRQLGGVEGALGTRADAILQEKYPSSDQQDKLRHVLLRLVQLGEGVADTRRRVPLSQLALGGDSPEDVKALLRPLVDGRLIVINDTLNNQNSVDETPQSSKSERSLTNLDNAAATIEVAHEALIHGWQTLHQWIEAARDTLRSQSQLSEAAKEWSAAQENPDFLWGGLRLQNANAWQAQAQPLLTSLETRFLEASRAALAEQQRLAEEAQQEKEKQAQALLEEQRRRADSEAKSARRLRLGAVALAVVAVVAVIAGFFAQQNATRARSSEATAVVANGQAVQRAAEAQTAQAQAVQNAAEAQTAQAQAQTETKRAEDQTRRTQIGFARQLALQARSDVDGTLDRSLLLSLEANNMLESNKLPDDSEVRGSLLAGLASSPYLTTFLRKHTQGVVDLSLSPDGTQLASSDGEHVIIWDVAQRQPVQYAHPITISGDLIAFSPKADQSLLAVSDCLISQASMSGGALTAIPCSGGSIFLWDTKKGTSLPLPDPRFGLGANEYGVSALAFSPDGQTLASGGKDGTIILWNMQNIASPQKTGVLTTTQSEAITRVVFNSDGTKLASSNTAGTISVWDMQQTPPQVIFKFDGKAPAAYSLAFRQDGILASGHDDGTVILWDVTNNKGKGRFTAHSYSVTDLNFTSDGQILTTAGKDGVINTWNMQDVANPSKIHTLTGHNSGVNRFAYLPDGRLFTASDDTTIGMWDLSKPKFGQILADPASFVYSVAFSPNGKLLASGGCGDYVLEFISI